MIRTVRRKKASYLGPQKLARIPPYRPGEWVKIKDFADGKMGSDLSGQVRRVRSLTGGFHSPEQKRVIWRVHFEDGRCLEWHLIERHAEETEIRRAGGRR